MFLEYRGYNGHVFVVDSTEGMRLTSTGLGIGTTVPAFKLESSCSSQSTSYPLAVRNPDNSTCLSGVGILGGLGRTADSTIQYYAMMTLVKEQAWTGTGSTIKGSLLFSTPCNESGVERMRITSGGCVAIGTTSPTTLLELSSSSGPEITIQRADTSIAADDVVGGIRFSSNDSSTAFGSPPHYGAGIKVKSAGTVGLQNMFFYAGQNNLGYENDTPSMQLVHSGDVVFYNTSAANGMQWDASESALGIGTSAPLYLLDVRTSSNHRFFVRDSSTSSGGEVQIQAGNDDDSATTPLKFAACRFFFESGQVGIGTGLPAARLDVAGGGGGVPCSAVPCGGVFIRVSDTNTVGQGAVLRLQSTCGAKENAATLSAVNTSGNNGDLAFNMYAGGADHPERMRLTSAGNLGIATNAPNARLSIQANSSNEGMELQTPSSGSFQIGVHNVGGSSGTSIQFRRGGSDGFDTLSAIIDNAGCFGIGTDAPGHTIQAFSSADDAVIEVASSASNSNPAFRLKNDAQEWQWQLRGAEADSLVAWDVTGGAGRLYLTTGGNLGLGTTCPHTSRVMVEGIGTTTLNSCSKWISIGAGSACSYTANNVYGIGFGYTNTSNKESAAFFGYKVTNASAAGAGRLLFATRTSTCGSCAPTERATILADGKFGIGTTAPNAALGINFNPALVNGLELTDSRGTNCRALFTQSGALAGLYATDNGSYGTASITIGTANAGIATSAPCCTFHVMVKQQ